MIMSDPMRVRVEGPLVPWVPGFRDFLVGRGYSPNSTAQQLQLIANLSGWMLIDGVGVRGLSSSVVDAFFRYRSGTHQRFHSWRALIPFFCFLDSAGIERENDLPVALSASEVILCRFSHYLTAERALRATTVENYLNQMRPFLRWRVGLAGEDFRTLTANEITSFLLFRGVEESVGSIRVAATALRALLKWMYLVQITPVSLAGAIGPIAYSSYAGLPKALTAQQFASVSGQADLSRWSPCRDRALLLVFSRLGLRSREAADLCLEDISWRRGTVTISGKGGRLEVMPLPIDVGAALADYLEHERLTSPERHVFLQARAPHAPLGRSGVSMVITGLGARAEIVARMGAHRLRHTSATAVIAAGGSLIEAAQLLRHASTATTVIYAKVDVLSLQALTRPWPHEGTGTAVADGLGWR
jgi:integrase/recombinase XerD